MNKFLTFVFIGLCWSAFSQKTIDNQRVWFSYMGQYKVSKNWGYHIEAQFRLDNELKQNHQNLFRVGGIYFLSATKNISGGYALINTFSPSLDGYYRENRAWEQFQYNKLWHENKNTMSHRIRLEQRWVEGVGLVAGNAVTLASNYQNRVRYLNRNLIHLGNLNSGNEELYIVVQDEVFMTLGDNKINKNFIDQNRFLIGIGLNYNKNIRLELGYLNQFISSSFSNDVMNHTVSVSLIQNLVLQKE